MCLDLVWGIWGLCGLVWFMLLIRFRFVVAWVCCGVDGSSCVVGGRLFVFWVLGLCDTDSVFCLD